MVKAQTRRGKYTQWMNRAHARLAAYTAKQPVFAHRPEPQSIGLFAKGRQLVAGNFLFSGDLIEAPGASIWDIAPEDSEVALMLQNCSWLDDLAAVGDAAARERAQTWVFEWIDRYGRGHGPGWTPELTGRRLIRWINHAYFLLRAREKDESDRFMQSLGAQTKYLSKRWKGTKPGLERFEALCGLVYASLALDGSMLVLDDALSALAKECKARITEDGGIDTRNPEELLEVFTLLGWAVTALEETGRTAPQDVTDAMGRIAPTLRALRHSDGGLARFHGGGRGIDGRLDHALALLPDRTVPKGVLHMGYGRITGGRTSVIIDADAPPSGPASHDAHASTCSMEVTSGRRPLIVNCGSGSRFGLDWRRFGRATASHSTLAIEGYSSARLGKAGKFGSVGHELLVDIPDHVPTDQSSSRKGEKFEVAHNGYQATHGLMHARILDLSHDGRTLEGEELLATLSEADKKRFDVCIKREPLGIPYSVRFHLHPDVEASLDMGGTAVSLTLKSGEIWVFRHDGRAEMNIEPSVYLENGRLRPRTSQQVVLTGRAMAYATRIRWSLAKAHETPSAVRDYVQDDLAELDQD